MGHRLLRPALLYSFNRVTDSSSEARRYKAEARGKERVVKLLL